MTALPAGLPELYDLDCGEFSEDLPFYESLARRCEGPALELGVGTGRVAIHLARAGLEVWGLDTSEPMLERARCTAGQNLGKRLRLQHADMRDFDLGRSFELAFAAFGTFHQLLESDDQLACLRCVRRHLAPSGLFAFDLRPWWFAGWEEGTSVPFFHDWTRVFPATGETVIKLRSIRADRARQVQHETHVYDLLAQDGTVRRATAAVDSRFSTRYEVEGLLDAAGLELRQIYGDFELSPFDETSEYMITIARRPAEEPS